MYGRTTGIFEQKGMVFKVMSIFNKKAVKNPRYRVNQSMPGLKAALYKLTNRPYLDMRVYRGYRELCRIVTPDTGAETFTIEGIGTFIMPSGEALLKQYHDKNALYLTWNIASCSPGIPVEAEKWTQYEYPPLNPAEFQKLMEAQTVADLLSETGQNNNWIWYLLIGGLILFVAMMVLQGV